METSTPGQSEVSSQVMVGKPSFNYLELTIIGANGGHYSPHSIVTTANKPTIFLRVGQPVHYD